MKEETSRLSGVLFSDGRFSLCLCRYDSDDVRQVPCTWDGFKEAGCPNLESSTEIGIVNGARDMLGQVAGSR